MKNMTETSGTADNRNDTPLEIEYWPLDRLVPYARNARTHSDAQVAEIAGSIRAFGFSNPILISEAGDVIARDQTTRLFLRYRRGRSGRCALLRRKHRPANGPRC